VGTTVELALLGWESKIAEGMAASATYDAVARELIDTATKNGTNAADISTQQVNGLVESAKAYTENIAKLFEGGEIVDNRAIREFAAERATAMVSAWMIYRLRLLTAYENINPAKN
jgi:hypothetical protein